MLKDSLDAILSYVSRMLLTYRGYEITTMPRVRNLSKVEVLGQANLCCSLVKKYGEDWNRDAETEFNKSLLSKTTVVNIFNVSAGKTMRVSRQNGQHKKKKIDSQRLHVATNVAQFS